MTGSALTRQMSNDGTQAYTLYIDTAHNIAFVHILPLDASFPFARCVDLAAGIGHGWQQMALGPEAAGGIEPDPGDGRGGRWEGLNVARPVGQTVRAGLRHD